MPIYEYECKNCGYRLEKLQKVNDKPLKTCPTTGKKCDGCGDVDKK